jgi:putative FmdB family regulatory protein
VPIYEYRCQECEREFEQLVIGGTVVSCPACGASRVMRRLSLFQARRESPVASGVPVARAGGGCCGGGCGCR